MSRPFPARFGGVCDRCDNTIRPGDKIAFPVGGTDPVHVRCLHHDDDDDPTRVGNDETVCATCRLVHAGECL